MEMLDETLENVKQQETLPPKVIVPLPPPPLAKITEPLHLSVHTEHVHG